MYKRQLQEFAAGTGAPAWFQSLPTDIQTYLVPASVLAAIEATPTATSGSVILSNVTTAPGAVITSAAQNATALSGLGAIPVIINATTTANGTVYANATAHPTGAVGTGGVANGTGVAGPYANTTSMTMAGMTMTKASSSTGASAVDATTAAASTSKAASGNAGVAGVAVPTGVLGVGLAGLVGVVGVLAL